MSFDNNDPYDYSHSIGGSFDRSSEAGSINPNYSSTQQEPIEDPETLRRKAKELTKREFDLERREYEFQAKVKSQLTNNNNTIAQPSLHYVEAVIPRATTTPQKNFPFCYPIMYHNIGSIPSEFMRRKVVYMGFISWIIFSLCTVLNAAAAYTTVFYPLLLKGIPLEVTTMMKVQYLVVATVMIFFLPPAHFFLTYYPLYKAMEKGTVPRFVLFFISYGVVIIFCLFGVSGFMTYGFSGVIIAVYFDPNIYGGVIGGTPAFACNVAMAVIWLLLAINFIVILVLGAVAFKRLKGSFKQLKDFGTTFVDGMNE